MNAINFRWFIIMLTTGSYLDYRNNFSLLLAFSKSP